MIEASHMVPIYQRTLNLISDVELIDYVDTELTDYVYMEFTYYFDTEI